MTPRAKYELTFVYNVLLINRNNALPLSCSLTPNVFQFSLSVSLHFKVQHMAPFAEEVHMTYTEMCQSFRHKGMHAMTTRCTVLFYRSVGR